MSIIRHFVDGKLFEEPSKRTSNVFNPATGESNFKVI